MTPPDLRLRANEPGASILVGSVDAAGVPACCRGIALVANDACSSATVYVPLSTSRDIVANAATTRRLAVVASHVIDHASIQLKGTVREIRLAGAAEESLVNERLEAFAASLDRIGLPRRITRSFSHWPAFAIDLSVDEIYDQTPGPKAGIPIR